MNTSIAEVTTATAYRAAPSVAEVDKETSAGGKERLPFTVRVVHSRADLAKAVQIRHSAYARHVPEFAQTLREPEAMDSEPGVVVLLAESKVDGSPLGTMRIQTNAFKPLALEQSVTLPHWLQGRALAEATRLGITQDRIGRLVKVALFKAFYLYCRQAGIDWMVVAGRAPIDRQYEQLMFKDVYPELGYIPLRHANNMPHRVMALEVDTADSRSAAARHPLHQFIFRTRHEDLRMPVSTRLPHRMQATSTPVWLS